MFADVPETMARACGAPASETLLPSSRKFMQGNS